MAPGVVSRKARCVPAPRVQQLRDVPGHGPPAPPDVPVTPVRRRISASPCLFSPRLTLGSRQPARAASSVLPNSWRVRGAVTPAPMSTIIRLGARAPHPIHSTKPCTPARRACVIPLTQSQHGKPASDRASGPLPRLRRTSSRRRRSPVSASPVDRLGRRRGDPLGRVPFRCAAARVPRPCSTPIAKCGCVIALTETQTFSPTRSAIVSKATSRAASVTPVATVVCFQAPPASPGAALVAAPVTPSPLIMRPQHQRNHCAGSRGMCVPVFRIAAAPDDTPCDDDAHPGRARG